MAGVMILTTMKFVDLIMEIAVIQHVFLVLMTVKLIQVLV